MFQEIKTQIHPYEFSQASAPFTLVITEENMNFAFFFPHQNDVVSLVLRREDIKEINNYLHKSADEIVGQINKDVSREKLSSLLISPKLGLASRGHVSAKRIFRNYLPALETIKGQNGDIPIFEIRSDVFTVPWEWLYNISPQDIKLNGELISVMKPFWAINKIVSRRRLRPRRAVNEPLDEINSLKINSRPTIGLIIDNSKYAKRELDVLQEAHKANKIRLKVFNLGEDSNKYDDWYFIRSLNKFLNQEEISIIHFACHAEIPDPKDKMSSYFLVYDGQKERKYQLDFLYQHPEVLLQKPLIFLNVCSTGNRYPLTTFDFIGIFRDLGAKNIIAAESAIESELAMNFASEFYKHFLSGRPLGESVFSARYQIIAKGKENTDVVTLFYGLYGDPLLSIAKKSEGSKSIK